MVADALRRLPRGAPMQELAEEIKRTVFAELDRLCPEHAVLATNSSYLMSSQIADATGEDERIVAQVLEGEIDFLACLGLRQTASPRVQNLTV